MDPSETDLDAIKLALAGASHILVTAAPVKGGDPVLRCPAIHDLLRLSDRIEWVGYLSTVGVYGNKDGQEVDEATLVNPSSERGRRRVRLRMITRGQRSCTLSLSLSLSLVRWFRGLCCSSPHTSLARWLNPFPPGALG